MFWWQIKIYHTKLIFSLECGKLLSFIWKIKILTKNHYVKLSNTIVFIRDHQILSKFVKWCKNLNRNLEPKLIFDFSVVLIELLGVAFKWYFSL